MNVSNTINVINTGAAIMAARKSASNVMISTPAIGKISITEVNKRSQIINTIKSVI
jgi:hypothetical protein